MARFSKPRISKKLTPLLRRRSADKLQEDFGVAGRPVNTANPFYFGFMAAVGVLIAITTMRALASASAVFILIIISIFLAYDICCLQGMYWMSFLVSAMRIFCLDTMPKHLS